MKVWMLTAVLVTLSFSAFSSEFTHIKLNPEFEQYLTKPQSKSVSVKSFSKSANVSALSAPNPIESKMIGALLGTSSKSVGGDESPLYQEIRNHLEAAHEQLAMNEVQNITRLNQQFNLGTENFSGFSWQKPFGVVQVHVDRQVTPNLFGQNWLVMDTFTFELQATTFLEKLAEAGLSSMSALEIGAFAGITFKRVYTYWHYAESYQAGLVSDFSKLFLQFLKFNQRGMEAMANEEVMKREDQWTASAGGIITSPPIYNVSLSGAILAQYDYQNVATIQSHHSGVQRYKVSSLSKKTKTIGASVELQLDFFKLLKFSLLRYELDYEYASGTEFHLGFSPTEWAKVKNDNELDSEFRSILRGQGSIQKLEPYVVELDESSSSATEQKGNLLLWGRMQKQKTEQIRVIKDNMTRVFYKNYAQNVKIVQNFFSRIFSAIVFKIFKLPVGVANAAIYSRQVTMEYEATNPQATDPKVTRIDNSEQFSFVLTQYYNAARTDRWIDRTFKNDLIWFVDNFTTLPKTYKSDIRNEILKGPMTAESNLRVEKAGFEFFLNFPENNLFYQLAKVCKSERVDSWSQEQSRREMLNRFQTDSENCVKNLGKIYLAFKQDYLSSQLKPSLARFKDFITQYYKQAGNIADLQVLFGASNTFINGSLTASTGMGLPFNTTFSAGQFRGLGVIDNFKRGTGSRMPASIVSE